MTDDGAGICATDHDVRENAGQPTNEEAFESGIKKGNDGGAELFTERRHHDHDESADRANHGQQAGDLGVRQGQHVVNDGADDNDPERNAGLDDNVVNGHSALCSCALGLLLHGLLTELLGTSHRCTPLAELLGVLALAEYVLALTGTGFTLPFFCQGAEVWI